MSEEGRVGRRSNSRTKRLSCSPIIIDEDKSNAGFIDSFGNDGHCPPRTAVIRRSETRCLKTNQTTGLKVAEQFTKNLSMMTSVKQQLVTQKECMKMGSARPITSRGQRERSFHGIRHFQGILHSKIRDLTLEIEKLHRKSNDAQQEYINSVTYEAKAKELASDITNFQKTFADLNLAFDYLNRIGDIDELEQEVRQLQDLNTSEKRRIEGLFNERKLKEQFVHQIENSEQGKNVITSSHPHVSKGREQYIYFNNRLSQSSKAVEFWEKQIQQYKKVKELLNQKLKTKYPFMDDIISHEIKLKNLKRKWSEINKNSPLSLYKEREIILETVKQDKYEITGMECNIQSFTIQIDNLREIINHLKSTESELPNIKENVDIYLSSFDNEQDNEIKKINLLKSEITHYLSDLMNKLSLIPTATDYLNLHENKTGEIEISQSIDSQEEHSRAEISLKKLELMEFYQTKECKYLDEKSNQLKDDLEEYKSQKNMIDMFETKENKLTNQIMQLEEDNRTHLKELEMAKAQLEKLENEISENECHKELLVLEKKQCFLEEDTMLMKQTINEMKTTATHLLEIKSKTLSLMALINSGLINRYE